MVYKQIIVNLYVEIGKLVTTHHRLALTAEIEKARLRRSNKSKALHDVTKRG